MVINEYTVLLTMGVAMALLVVLFSTVFDGGRVRRYTLSAVTVIVLVVVLLVLTVGLFPQLEA